MESVFLNRSSVIAVLLLAATVLSWLVFEQHIEHFYASVIIITIILLKVGAILYSFMELSSQLFVWRVAFNIWLLVVGVALFTGSYTSFF